MFLRNLGNPVLYRHMIMLVHMCMLVIHMLVMLTAVVSDVGNQLTLLGDQRRL